ncbi:MAG: hypothetical protein V4500_04735 [Pseudomonadota bacterium]
MAFWAGLVENSEQDKSKFILLKDMGREIGEGSTGNNKRKRCEFKAKQDGKASWYYLAPQQKGGTAKSLQVVVTLPLASRF